VTNQRQPSANQGHSAIARPKRPPYNEVRPTQVESSSSPKETVLEDYHGTFAEFHEGYVRAYIALADTKAAWTFAVSSGVLAYLLGSDNSRALLLNPSWTPQFVIGATAVLFLSLSSVCSFLVIAPRLSVPSGDGVVFFGHVAARPTAAKFVSDIAKLKFGDIIEARLRHAYDVAKICDRKYGLLRKAIWLGFPGLLSALLFSIVL